MSVPNFLIENLEYQTKLKTKKRSKSYLLVRPMVQPVPDSGFYRVFCGFLNIGFFIKPKPDFFLGHRIYRFNRGSGSGFKTLQATTQMRYTLSIGPLISNLLWVRTVMTMHWKQRILNYASRPLSLSLSSVEEAGGLKTGISFVTNVYVPPKNHLQEISFPLGHD